MASDVKINVGVSGVAQFKQGMKESQAAVKNLEQQLKLNEAQLKATGNEELYLQNKTALLTKQIEEQKSVVAKADQALQSMKRNGVEQSSVAFQNMQQQVYKASTQLMEMQAELNGVGESGQEAADNVSSMNYQLNNISRNVSFENVVNGIGKITDAMEEAARVAVQLGKKIVQAMLSGGQWADDLQTTADQWEMSPEQVYRMQQTANLIDTDAETIFQARQKLIKAMGSESDKGAMGAFAALGISNLTGSDQNIEDVFWKAGQGLMQMEDKVARNEYAMKLYGRSWTDLIPIFKAGRETYEETMASWTWIGDDQFENLTKLNDEEQKLTTEWENFQHQFEAALAPAMTEIMKTLEGLLKEFNTYLSSPEGQEMLGKLGEAVSSLFSDLTTIDPEQVVSGIVDLFNRIKEGFEWVIDHKDDVVTALKVIAGGFAILKLGELAANIGQIVTGLGGLMGGKGGQAASSAAASGTAASGVSGGIGAVAGKLGTAATAVLLGYPIVKKIMEEGTDWLNPWSDYYKDMDKKTADTLSTIAGKDMSDIYNRAMNPAYTANWMPEKSPFAENLQNYYDDPLQHKVVRGNPLEEAKAAESLDRMNQVAGEMNGEVANMTQANADMTAAVSDLSALPENLQTAVTNAIIAGMNNVTIVINEGAVSAVGERISYGFGGKVQAMTK